MEQKGEILIYRSKQGNTKIDARLVNESVSLIQKTVGQVVPGYRSKYQYAH